MSHLDALAVDEPFPIPGPLATIQGREHALTQLRKRREKYKGNTRTHTDQCLTIALCISCNGVVGTYVVSFYKGDAPRFCCQCQALKDCGWLE